MRTEFGKRLLEARKNAKMTQHQVALGCGMSQSNYAQMETVAAGSVYTPAVAEFLGVNVQWLAYGRGEPNQTAERLPPSSERRQQHGGLSVEAAYLALWLEKIASNDMRARLAHACVALIVRELDGPASTPIAKPEPQSETPSVAHQAH